MQYKNIKNEYNIKNRGNEEIQVKLIETIPKNSNVKFKTSCIGICSTKKRNTFVREYIITIKPNNEYKFTTEYKINY